MNRIDPTGLDDKAAFQIPIFEKNAYAEPSGPVEAAGNVVRFAENVTKEAFNQVIGAANVALNEGADIADQGLSQWGMQKFHQLSELPNNVIRMLGEDFQNLGRDIQSVGAWENAFASALLLFTGTAKTIKSLLTPRAVSASLAGKSVIVGQGSKIAPYRELQAVTRGQRGAIQAHHILEQRHLRAWGYSADEILQAPSQVLSRAEHSALTRALQDALPTGEVYSRSQVWAQYQRVYQNYPGYLDAISSYFE